MKLIPVEPEFVYMMIPADYIGVYQKILIMLADYGNDITNSSIPKPVARHKEIIDCHNMFNAAVAARKLGNIELANKLIHNIKYKINNLYHGFENARTLVFPLDEHGDLKALVTCGERPLFQINADDGKLYQHIYNKGFDEHFRLTDNDMFSDHPELNKGLVIVFDAFYEEHISECMCENGSHSCVSHNHNSNHDYEHDHYNHYDSHNHHYNHDHVNPYYYNIHHHGHNHRHLDPDYSCNCHEVKIWHPCGDLYVYFDGVEININDCDIHKYFDNRELRVWHDIQLTKEDVGLHEFKLVVNYGEHTKILKKNVEFKLSNNENTNTNIG